MKTATPLPIVFAITGASGAAYAARLIQQLALADQQIHLLISPSGAAVVAQELGVELGPTRDNVRALLGYTWPTTTPHAWKPMTQDEIEVVSQRIHYHDYRNYFTPIASGSFLTKAMIICPCSGATLSGVVHASGNNLIQRAADVHLKEHRKLLLVPRETPLSVFQLENMTRAAQAGAVVMPAMPGWYHGVQTPVDLIDFVVARVMDHLQIPHQLIKRWEGPELNEHSSHSKSGDE
ncbi:MAG: UbiX family flavin prenyltransferase [Pirellula sp.]|jgi:4-hydroxy-3-polyprenylbenzoate decarboxylase